MPGLLQVCGPEAKGAKRALPAWQGLCGVQALSFSHHPTRLLSPHIGLSGVLYASCAHRTSTECRDLALAFGRVTYVPSLDVGKLQTSGLLKQSSALQLLSRSGPQTRLALRRTRRLETSLLPRAVVDALQAAEAALSTAAALTLLQCATRTLQRPLSALQNVQLSVSKHQLLAHNAVLPSACCLALPTLQMLLIVYCARA